MKLFSFLTGGTALALALTAAAQAQDTATTSEPPADESAAMSVELNKAEQIERGCQYFLLLRNTTDYDFQTFRLDFYFFDTEGVIAKRLLVDTPPVKPGDTRVAGFVASDLQCDSVSQILVNGVEPCEVAGGAAPDCYGLLALGNRTDIEFFK
jgi:hypothetical protein